MLVIPAIDLKDGRCVRLRQGDMRAETVYSDDPAAMARHWEQTGAQRLHVVDLNGAIEGQPKNTALIEAILKAVSIPVQVGGGIRSLDTVRMYLSGGASRVVVGTAALQDLSVLERACSEFPERILVGVDVRGGRIAVRGWTAVSDRSARDLLQALSGFPLGGIIHTDIARDGMLEGPDLSSLRDVLEWSSSPVIASGGVSRVEDLQAIKALGPRIVGVIVGKALYDGKLDLQEALKAAS